MNGFETLFIVIWAVLQLFIVFYIMNKKNKNCLHQGNMFMMLMVKSRL